MQWHKSKCSDTRLNDQLICDRIIRGHVTYELVLYMWQNTFYSCWVWLVDSRGERMRYATYIIVLWQNTFYSCWAWHVDVGHNRTKSFLEYWGCRTRQPGRTWLIRPGAVLVLIQKTLGWELMVQIKLKGVIRVESPSPRSFWCGTMICGIPPSLTATSSFTHRNLPHSFTATWYVAYLIRSPQLQ